MPMTRRSTPGVSGPRSTRSPRKIARRPSGGGRRPGGRLASRSSGVAELGQQLLELGPAAVHVADDVERAGLVAQVVEQLGAGDRGGGDLFGRAQDVHRAEALALEPGQAAAQLAALAAEHVRAEVPVLAAGVALRAELLRQVQDDRHRQHVVRAGQHDELAAGFGLHVGRVDDGEPAARPAAGPRCSAAARTRPAVADWSFSSSATRPRQKSEEITSVGLKCARANVDLPEPVDARPARPGSARARSSVAEWCLSSAPRPREDGQLGGRACVGVLVADGQEADLVAGGCLRRVRPSRGTAARVHSKRWSRCRIAPARERREVHVVLGVGRGDDDGGGRGEAEHDALEAPGRRSGSRCSMTSISTAASSPASRSSR